MSAISLALLAHLIPRSDTAFAQRVNEAPICNRWELVSCRSRLKINGVC